MQALAKLFRPEALQHRAERHLGEPRVAVNALYRWFRPRLRVVYQTAATDCGLACLAMALQHHGRSLTLQDLRAKFEVSMRGTTLADLIAIATAVGLVPRAVKAELLQLDQLALPCILHWDMDHFVVLEQVSKRELTVLDPAHGRRSMPPSELSKHFTGVVLELEPSVAAALTPRAARFGFRDLVAPLRLLRRPLALALLCAAVVEALALAAPVFLQAVVDRAIHPTDRNLLLWLCLVFAAATVLQAGLTWLRSIFLVDLNIAFLRHWFLRVYATLIQLPLPFFQARYVSDIVARFQGVREIQKSLSFATTEVVLDGLMAAVTIVVLFWYAPALGAISSVAFASYCAARYVIGRKQVAAACELLQHTIKQQCFLHESIRVVPTIKLFVAEPRRLAQWSNLLTASFNREIRAQQLVSGASTVRTLVLGLENVATISLGAHLVMSQKLSLGMLFAYYSFKTLFQTRAFALADRGAEISLLRPHLDQLADVLCAATEKQHVPGHTSSRITRLELRAVSYRYSHADPLVLRDCSFSTAAGETLAITGPSGSGKSTLIRVLVGLVKPTAGELTVDGQTVTESDMRWYRGHIGAVLQDDQLTNGSIGDNICFSDPRPDLDHMRWCAQMAQIHDELEKMPLRYDTLCGDMGSALSGGQRQRVLLARALYKRPAILVMDEATSNLDVERERRIYAALRELPLIKVLVAHRYETLAIADRVLTLDAGRFSAPAPDGAGSGALASQGR